VCERIKSWQNATTAVEPGQIDHQVVADQDHHVHPRVEAAAAVAVHLRVDQVDRQEVVPAIHAQQVAISRLVPRIGRAVIVQEVIVLPQTVHAVFHHVIQDLAILVHVILVLPRLVRVVMTARLGAMIVMIVHVVAALRAQAVMTVRLVVTIVTTVLAVFHPVTQGLAIQGLVILVRVILVLPRLVRAVMTARLGAMIVMIVHAVAALRAQAATTVRHVATIVGLFLEVTIAVMSGAVQMVSAATIAILLVAQAITVVMIAVSMNKLTAVMQAMRFVIRVSLTTLRRKILIRACRRNCVRYLKACKFLWLVILLPRNAPWQKKISILQLSM